jgi:RHS repeat-associated protein
MAKLNPFRFSTKYQDDETDFLYYGYRYYNPSTGRWLSRDLIGENGGLNLYCFIGNDSIGKADYLGLEQIQIWASAYIPSVWFIFPYPAALDPAAIWLGDGRRGPVVGGSARAYHLLTIETDPTKNPVVSNTSGGGVTTVIYYTSGGGVGVATAADTAPPLATVTRTASGCTTIVEMSADTHDPLVSFAPSLHYDYTMRFDAAAGRLTIVGSHGRFPAFDVVVGGKTYVNYVPTGIDDTPAGLYFPRMDVVATGTIQKYPCCSK